jgi:hypothetical protein
MVEMAWLLPDSTLRSGTIVRKRHLYSFPEACIFFVGWPNVLNLAVTAAMEKKKDNIYNAKHSHTRAEVRGCVH